MKPIDPNDPDFDPADADLADECALRVPEALDGDELRHEVEVLVGRLEPRLAPRDAALLRRAGLPAAERGRLAGALAERARQVDALEQAIRWMLEAGAGALGLGAPTPAQDR